MNLKFWEKAKVPSGSNIDDEKERSRKSLVVVRTQFLRNMSHQIDTDMIHRLTRSSSKFRQISDKSTIPNFVSTIFDVGEEYGTMLTHVLKYYDSVNGKFKVVDGPILIRNVVADAKTDAKQQMLRVSKAVALVDIDIRYDVPISEMISDGPVIKECLQELIYNGLRHDENSHVSVYVTAMSHDPCHVTFSVENKGIRIKDEDMADMFTPFHSIHRGIVHGSGLGIGLARCKRMAHELGGDVSVQNGEVTTFSMTIPIKHDKDIRLQHDGRSLNMKLGRQTSKFWHASDVDEDADVFPSKPFAETAERPSILVVDDSLIARRRFEEMMKHVDIDVDLCDNPSRCLKMVEGKTYDVVCLDIIMPVMSGITCAHHIREGATSNKSTPIIIITADSSVETRQLSACISGSMLLEKPAKHYVLYRTIMSSITDASRKEWMRKTWHEKRSTSSFS
ncbi:unnamed protein product [Ectocarpus sp. 12 AP-2014]